MSEWPSTCPCGSSSRRFSSSCAGAPTSSPFGTGSRGSSRSTGRSATNEAEIYDPAGDAWSPVVAMGAANARASATVLKTGDVVIAGGGNDGRTLASLEIFDTGNSAFQLVPGALSSPWKSHAAALLSDGRVLIAGGSNVVAALGSADIFDLRRRPVFCCHETRRSISGEPVQRRHSRLSDHRCREPLSALRRYLAGQHFARQAPDRP